MTKWLDRRTLMGRFLVSGHREVYGDYNLDTARFELRYILGTIVPSFNGFYTPETWTWTLHPDDINEVIGVEL